MNCNVSTRTLTAITNTANNTSSRLRFESLMSDELQFVVLPITPHRYLLNPRNSCSIVFTPRQTKVRRLLFNRRNYDIPADPVLQTPEEVLRDQRRHEAKFFPQQLLDLNFDIPEHGEQ